MSECSKLDMSGNCEASWGFTQVKGDWDEENAAMEENEILCVEFNFDGNLIATGDKSGRVEIYQRDASSKSSTPKRCEYNEYLTFQSHEKEFDPLQSTEIKENINQICWLRQNNPAHFLLTTNDKCIKLWKVAERNKKIGDYNTKEENGAIRDPRSITSLRVPSVKTAPALVEASPRRIFNNAHRYQIHSIAINSDQATFLSADDLQIHLWNLEITNKTFNIVNKEPTSSEVPIELITATDIHPTDCNLFVYSNSKGKIRLCDLRSSAICDQHAKEFEQNKQSFFGEIINAIADVKLSHSGRYMISRDYLNIKVWDLHMEARPIETFPVQEFLRGKLFTLLENNCIFDKFGCCWSGNDSSFITGSYSNLFTMHDLNPKKEVIFEVSMDMMEPEILLKPQKICSAGQQINEEEHSVDCLDFNRKILDTAWHPSDNIIAIAANNNLFLYQRKF